MNPSQTDPLPQFEWLNWLWSVPSPPFLYGGDPELPNPTSSAAVLPGMSRTEKHLMELLFTLVDKQTKAIDHMNVLASNSSQDTHTRMQWMRAQKEVLEIGEEIAQTVRDLREVRKPK
ncbi:MAG TPA: hypothetical protein VHD56_01770 [Tepidisphaeraceae bacterium]|nr:hypothetical protein [Tepidisphaeraceae bacterium]